MANHFKKGCFLFLSFLLFTFASTLHAQTHSQAVMLNINAGIGPAIADFVDRGISNAEKDSAPLVILRMNTPGGLGKSMRTIIQRILASKVPVVTFVAPSGARAASAGTFILYASHVAAMAPGTNLGAATPVAVGAPGTTNKYKKNEPSASEKKALNDSSAYIRSLAQLRGRNVKWGVKAVTKAASLSASEALSRNVIDVVAKDVPELLTKINGKKVNLAGKTVILKTANLTAKTIVPDWRMKLLTIITDPNIAYILMLLGMYGLFFEFANPGLVVPGVVGAISLLLAVYAFQLLPINYVGLALIVLGIIFLVSEAFVPSFGALGIGGIIAFVFGSILLLDKAGPGFQIALPIILTFAAITAAFFLVVLNMTLRSRRRPVVSGQESLIGKEGMVFKEKGEARIKLQGESWHVKSAQPLQAGEKVRVLAVDGLILSVEHIDKESEK